MGHINLSTVAQGANARERAPAMLSLLRRWVEITAADFARLCLEGEWEAKNVIRNYPEPDGVNPYMVFNTDLTEGLPGVFWATYFGKPYVEWIGEQVMRASPWPHVEQCAGGYLLVRSDSPATWNEEWDADARLRQHIGDSKFFDISAPTRPLEILKLDIPDYYSGASAEQLTTAAVQAETGVRKSKRRSRRLPRGSEAPAIVERVSFFRGIGFFADVGGRADGDIASELYTLQVDKWGAGFAEERAVGDIELLAWDRNRVWWEDTEADVGKGNHIYESVLPKWGDISRGAFGPREVVEEWVTESGPVEVAFSCGASRHTLKARYLNDYLDLSVLTQINEIIRSTGLSYCVFKEFDQTAFIVVLRADERNLLESQRGWSFRDI